MVPPCKNLYQSTHGWLPFFVSVQDQKNIKGNKCVFLTETHCITRSEPIHFGWVERFSFLPYKLEGNFKGNEENGS